MDLFSSSRFFVLTSRIYDLYKSPFSQIYCFAFAFAFDSSEVCTKHASIFGLPVTLYYRPGSAWPVVFKL